jgi:ABC-type glycerol-3-phosphate transport system substrate-binding protein
MKRILSMVLGLMVVLQATFLIGCIPANSSELKIALDIEDTGRYDELFAYFTTETGITIKATYGEDISKLIGTANEPDIIKTSTVVIESMKPALRSLQTLIDADAEVDIANYIDVVIDALTIDGEVYALPTSINTSLLYYNKTLFDASANQIRAALGLAPTDSVYPQADWTYADYQAAGVALSRFTVSPDQSRVYTQFGAETQLNWWGEWLVYLQQMGGSFYQENSSNHITAVNSQAAIQATQFYVDKAMGDASTKFAPNAIEAASSFSFLNGNVAMIFGGHMGDWHSYDALGLDWDIQVLPTPVGRPNATGGEIAADAFGISIRSDKPEAAFRFLKMWAGEEGAMQMYRYGKVGALKNMEALIEALPESDQKDLDVEALFDAIDRAVTLPKEKDFSKVMREMVMTEIYKLMFTGRGSETDVAAVLNRIKQNVDAYYAGLYN